MSTHKHIDKICCVALAFALILTVVFVNAEKLGVEKSSSSINYEKTLFDTTKVHTVDIIMNDWEDFIQNCTSEEYYTCSVVIDGEAFKNVAIRGKGNTSLSQVSAYGNDRYSFKIEFDHYDNANTYYGLDKLCLNNIIQDNTYMKDYLTYQMMNKMGVAAPLCSYIYITVNGEDWGLYLAVEGVEDSFLKRNYGNEYGELYKPDSLSMGGGRGNGEGFDIDKFLESSDTQKTDSSDEKQSFEKALGNRPENMPGNISDIENFDGQIPEGIAPGGEMPDEMPEDFSEMFGGGFGGFGNGSDDVLLRYIDDNFSSYSNIFDSAKTPVTDADKTRLIEALKNLSEGKKLDSTVDIEAVIRYFVVHNFVLNSDSYTGMMIHNYYLYENEGQMQMIPWDYNLAFGGFQSMGDATSLINSPIDSPVSGGNTADRPMIAWIFENEEYTQMYHEIFGEFISEYFDSGYFEKMMGDVKSMISPYIEKDPTKFCSYEEFETGFDTLKKFCLLRAESVSKQLDGSIGLTTDTQKSETFVDASDIDVSSMGSMGSFGGGGMSRPDKNEPEEEPSQKTEKPEETTQPEEQTTQTPSENEGGFNPWGNGEMPEGMTPPDMSGEFPFEMPEGMTPPDMSGDMPFNMPEGMTPPPGMPQMQ